MSGSKFNLLTVLAAIFTVCLVVSNVIAGKLWSAPFGIILTAGVFCFPIVYIINDLIPEVYGLKAAQKVILLGFAMNVLAVVFFGLTLMAAYPPFFAGQKAFEVVLGFTPRLLIASFCGYLIGTNANSYVLILIKKLTNAKYLWMRTIGSTLIGESLDSLVFISIAFYGIIPTDQLPAMIFFQAAFKTLYEAAVTPVTYWAVRTLKKAEYGNGNAVGQLE